MRPLMDADGLEFVLTYSGERHLAVGHHANLPAIDTPFLNIKDHDGLKRQALAALKDNGFFTPAELRMIDRTNAEKLFPRLKA